MPILASIFCQVAHVEVAFRCRADGSSAVRFPPRLPLKRDPRSSEGADGHYGIVSGGSFTTTY